jgi:hypothetical protein|tara:strand:- start:5105 stop:5317 length:213 start_codon:yes stop_codon:yes gene_type:complete
MKLNELIQSFSIALSNEEAEVLDKVNPVQPLQGFSPREQVIIENLIRKSLVSKVLRDNIVMVVQNEFKFS